MFLTQKYISTKNNNKLAKSIGSNCYHNSYPLTCEVCWWMGVKATDTTTIKYIRGQGNTLTDT